MSTAVDKVATSKVGLSIEGMTCASCVNRVQRALLKVPGVKEASVNLATETAEVTLDGGEEASGATGDLILAVDQAGYKAQAVKLAPIESERIVLEVSGMTCASCVNRVQRALLKVPGVKEASVNLATETAEVTLSDPLEQARLVDAVTSAGYGAEVAGASVSLAEASVERQARRHADLRSRLYKLYLGAALSAVVLVLSYGFSGASWSAPVQLVLAVPVYFWVGSVFHEGALRALRHGAANMDTLVSLGSSAAFVYSTAVVFFLSGKPTYFDVAVLVITLISLGKYLELAAKVHAGVAMEQLMTLQPLDAHLVSRAGSVVSGNQSSTADIPVDSLRLGDLVLVRPGESVPTDGVIVTGVASLDEALITGENLPMVRDVGDAVVGGSINGLSPFVMEVTQTGDETVLAQILEAVQRAQSAKSKVQRLADSVSSVFVPVIVLIALATLFGWLLSGHSFVASLIPAVSVLVVACPCAMGLATPMATLVGTTRGAASGLLLSGGESLEVANSITTIVMDKTGTLTVGRPVVTREVVSDGLTLEETLAIAAALEAGSEHPLARAVTSVASARFPDATAPVLVEHRVAVGMGVTAKSADLLHTYQIGSPEFLRTEAIDTDAVEEIVSERFAQGESVVALAIDGEITLLLGVSDPIRANAKAGVTALQALGIKVVLASGDRAGVVSDVASSLGIGDYHFGLTPQGKSDLIGELIAGGEVVAMVGDGINDAPALALADVGIAVGSGTAIAMASADITLIHGEVSAIVDAIALSKATRRIIWQNLGWAFGYNVVLVPLAVFGVLPPIYSALAMATSSVSVVLNSLRLRGFKSVVAVEATR